MITTNINAQYNVAKAGSLPLRVALRMRRLMYQRFLRETGVSGADTLLDVGVTSDQTYDISNYLEAWYPWKDRITAAGVDDANFLEAMYPGLRFVRADGKKLPFEDASFDIVHSSAVLEHVGSYFEQKKFVSELARVARKAIFITTPNRWFPIEFHTVLPFVHWLPPEMFRLALRQLGHAVLSREENLNLLGHGDLRRLCEELGLNDARVGSVRLWGWPSNLLLIIRKAQ